MPTALAPTSLQTQPDTGDTIFFEAPAGYPVQTISATREGYGLGEGTYYYTVVANYGGGSVASEEFAEVRGVQFDFDNHVLVSWSPVPGAVSYSVLRFDSPRLEVPSACLVGTTGELSLPDLGYGLAQYSLTQKRVATGYIRLDNSGATPVFVSDPPFGSAVGAVPSTRQVVAGYGLTGGGDLSQDRAFAVVDGATVQKVEVAVNNIPIGVRRRLNLLAGSNVTLQGADMTDRVNVTVSAAQTPWTQNVDAAQYDLNNLGVLRLAQVTLGELDPQSGLVGFANEAGTLHAKTGNGGSIDFESIGNGRVMVSTDGIRRIVVQQNGNVGIGPNMNPSYKLDVQGQVRSTSGGYVFPDGTIQVTAAFAQTIPVASVFGRTGAVVAQAGDYTAAQVTDAVSTLGSYADPAWIASVAWGKVTGTPATFPASPHTHDAGDIASGVLATARLGTGTADTTTYLRGDGTWQVVTAGQNQTPWLSNIDANYYELQNLSILNLKRTDTNRPAINFYLPTGELGLELNRSSGVNQLSHLRSFGTGGLFLTSTEGIVQLQAGLGASGTMQLRTDGFIAPSGGIYFPDATTQTTAAKPQTPWAQNIDGANYKIQQVDSITMGAGIPYQADSIHIQNTTGHARCLALHHRGSGHVIDAYVSPEWTFVFRMQRDGNMVVSGSYYGGGGGLNDNSIRIASLQAGDYSGKVTSGTYSINITGNANYASSAGYVLDSWLYTNSDMTQFYYDMPSRYIRMQESATGTPNANWCFIHNIKHSGGPHGRQIAYAMHYGNNIWTRWNDGANNWGAWQEILINDGRTYSISITGGSGSLQGLTIQNPGSYTGGNYIVRTDGSGHIYAHYLNSASPGSENAGIAHIWTDNGDGYMRKASLAHLNNNISPHWGNIQSKPDVLYQGYTGEFTTANHFKIFRGGVANLMIGNAQASQQFGQLSWDDGNKWFTLWHGVVGEMIKMRNDGLYLMVRNDSASGGFQLRGPVWRGTDSILRVP